MLHSINEDVPSLIYFFFHLFEGRPMKIELVGDKMALGGAGAGGPILAGRIGKKPRGATARPVDGRR